MRTIQTVSVLSCLLALQLSAPGSIQAVEHGTSPHHAQRTLVQTVPPRHETTTDTLRAVQTELFAIDALLTHPVDELERRHLKERVQKLHHTLSIALQQLTSAQREEALPSAEPALLETPSSLDETSLGALVEQLEVANYEDERADVLDFALKGKALTTAHARRILTLLPFENERLETATRLAPALVDPQNAFKLLDTLHFSTSRKALKRILADAATR